MAASVSMDLLSLLRSKTNLPSERQRVSSTGDWWLILGDAGLCWEVIKVRSGCGDEWIH